MVTALSTGHARRRLDGAALGLAIWQGAEDYERTIHRMPLRMVWGSFVCSSNWSPLPLNEPSPRVSRSCVASACGTTRFCKLAAARNDTWLRSRF